MKNVCYINAGAGSGKTFRLTTELTDMLLKDNIKPSQVILTTFTELAAAEFKEKICERLLDKDSSENERERRIALSVAMDGAAIGTVHSIALRFIQKYWYHLNYGADIEVMSDENERMYVSQSLANILSDEDLKLFEEYSTCFATDSKNGETKRWLDYLNSVIKKINYYNVNNLEESIEHSLESIRSIMCGPEITEEVKAAYGALLSKYADYLRTKPNKINDEKLAVINDNADYDSYYYQFDALDGNIFKGKSLKTFFKTLSDAELTLWESFGNYANSKTFLPVLENFVKRIFAVAENWNIEYKKYKEANHIVSYNDIELVFLDMLKSNNDLRNELSKEYKVLMVDEFQDSNPIQIKIFNEISELIALNGGRSIWVGDPKQAIYGFRGADTDLITSVAGIFDSPDSGSNLSSETLGKSWRSRKPLVDLVNSIFTKVFTAEEIPNRNHITLQPQYPDDLKEDAIIDWQIEYKNKEQCYNAVAFKVKELLDKKIKVKPKQRGDAERCIEYRDIAILIRRNDEADGIANALRSAGLPVSTPEVNIYQRKESHLVMAMLSYITEPYSAHLRADILNLINGKTTEEIINERLDSENVDEEEKEPFMILLNNLRQRIRLLSVKDIVNTIIYELNLHSVVARWNDADIRRQNLNTISEMAVKYENNCVLMGLGATVTGFLNYMRTVTPDIDADNTSNTVKVLTYHKSKGLEWPVVILLSLDWNVDDAQMLVKKQYMDVNEMLSETDSENVFDRKYFIHLFPSTVAFDKFKKKNVNAMLLGKIEETDIYKKLRAKTISESKRLLYVGMTRARDYLISVSKPATNLLWLKDINIDTDTSAKDGYSKLWGGDAPVAKSEAIDAVNLPPIAVAPQDSYQYLDKPYDRTLRNDRFVSPSKIEKSDADRADIIVKNGIGSGISREGFKNMAAVGTCIHNIFAVYRQGDAHNIEMAERIISRHLLQNELGGHAEDIIKAADALYDYLTNTYGSAVSTDREMPFYHVEGNHVVNGEIDLVWNYMRDGRECSVLVDYKSFPGSRDKIKEHTEQYIPQLRAYSKALAAAGRVVTDRVIYYAVQGCVAEVSITD